MNKAKQKIGEEFFTSGQVAKKLRISVSTLKRWLIDERIVDNVKQNSNGWKLFSNSDVYMLREYQKQKRKSGKQFSASILSPISK